MVYHRYIYIIYIYTYEWYIWTGWWVNIQFSKLNWSGRCHLLFMSHPFRMGTELLLVSYRFWAKPKKYLTSSDPHPDTLFWRSSFWHNLEVYMAYIHIISFLTFFLAFYLTYILTFCLAFSVALSLAWVQACIQSWLFLWLGKIKLWLGKIKLISGGDEDKKEQE